MFTSWHPRGNPICSICQFLWYKYFHRGQFEAATVLSLNWEEMSQLVVSHLEPAPAHL